MCAGFLLEETKLQTLFLVWANVLCPGMGVSSSQRLLGKPHGVAPSSDETKVNPLWSKGAEMHVRSMCAGQRRDFLD